MVQAVNNLSELDMVSVEESISYKETIKFAEELVLMDANTRLETIIDKPQEVSLAVAQLGYMAGILKNELPF